MASANKQCDQELSTNWIASNPDQTLALIQTLQGEIKQKNMMLKEARLARIHNRPIRQLRKKGNTNE
jgi:hypothetical protein|tara:strand:- start:16382 stop:16582 length:201 start_codon:yes stop_codon:yes gene_type:complete